MKLAIYGDSWANCSHGHYQYPDLDQQGWPNLLKDYNWYVDNWSQPGSSLYYSYSKFMATHSYYDRVVFVVTSVGRYTGSFTMRDGRERWVNSYDACDFLLNKDVNRRLLTPEDRQRVDHLRNWYMWLQDMTFEQDMQNLMLADIARTRPDAIVIPINQGVGVTATCMTEYQELFVRSCWPDRPDLLGAQHHRTWEELACVCHMTPEINHLVCASMRATLALGQWQPIIPDRVNHGHPGSYYVRLFSA
jgi:hypothetical protein